MSERAGSEQLHRSESPLRGLVRVSRRLVRELGANAPDQSLEEQVHDARVATKKLRAYSLLLRPVTGETVFREFQQPLREAARALSTHRDRDVAVTTLKLLGKRVGKRRRPAFADAADTLVKRTQAPKPLREKQRALAQLSGALESAVDEFATLKLRKRGWQVLGPGYALTYRQGLKRFGRFHKSGLPEDAHALRKRVKSLGFQMALLEAADPGSIAQRRASLKDLGHQLGQLHDCTVLVQLTVSKPLVRRISAKDLDRIRSAAGDWEAELAHECLPLAESLFAVTPEEFTSHLEHAWRGWRAPHPVGRER